MNRKQNHSSILFLIPLKMEFSCYKFVVFVLHIVHVLLELYWAFLPMPKFFTLVIRGCASWFLVKEFFEPIRRVFWVAFQTIKKINIVEAKTHTKTTAPFKIVKERPHEVPTHITPFSAKIQYRMWVFHWRPKSNYGRLTLSCGEW